MIEIGFQYFARRVSFVEGKHCWLLYRETQGKATMLDFFLIQILLMHTHMDLSQIGIGTPKMAFGFLVVEFPCGFQLSNQSNVPNPKH